jgi:hypothetical protein
MKNWKIIAALTLSVIAVALIATVALAAAYNPYRTMTPTTGFSGMMNGFNTNTAPSQATTPNQPYIYQNGGACMGVRIGNYVAPSYTTNTTTALTLDQAGQIAQRYVTALNNPDLKVTQVEEYTSNFYVLVSEKSTGNGAFELLVDKYTGNIFPEMGPNMMWNTKYTGNTGMMGIFTGLRGMMGLQRTPSTPMTVTVDQAKTDAQQYLTANFVGTTVGDTTTFSGYYTIEVLQNGNTYGMLSVNGYTGQVWYHTWHGSFIQETTLP